MTKAYAGVFNDNGTLRLRASAAPTAKEARRSLRRHEKPPKYYEGCRLLDVRPVVTDESAEVDELFADQHPDLLAKYKQECLTHTSDDRQPPSPTMNPKT